MKSILLSKGHDPKDLEIFRDGKYDDTQLALFCEKVNSINPMIIDHQSVLRAVMDKMYEKTELLFSI